MDLLNEEAAPHVEGKMGGDPKGKFGIAGADAAKNATWERANGEPVSISDLKSIWLL